MSGQGGAPSRQWVGVACVVLATIIFAWQDAITKTLVADYPITFIVMVRYWVFFLAGLYMVKQADGGLRRNVRSSRPVLQCLRGILLVAELVFIGLAFRSLGLAETTALFQTYPLFGTLLAAIVLKEAFGWRRCLALIAGFVGMLVMIRPGAGVLSVGALYALGAAVLFAFYMILTRLVGRSDHPATSLFYVGLVGTVVMTAGIPVFWVNMAGTDIWLLALLCLTSVSGHFLMIKALSHAPVTVIQPFNYLQLVWSIFVGLVVFGDMPDKWTLIGAAIVVASGLFVLYRERVRSARITTQEIPVLANDTAT